MDMTEIPEYWNSDSKITDENHIPKSNTKRRRGVPKACTSCHFRKQRCDGKSPCFRCIASNKECSYDKPGATLVVEAEYDTFMKETGLQFAIMKEKMASLQSQLDELKNCRSQIDSLKVHSTFSDVCQRHMPEENVSDTFSTGSESSPREKRQKMAIKDISLQSAPMKTVQSVVSISQIESKNQPTSIRSPIPLFNKLYHEHWTADPVTLGIITEEEAQSLISRYFKDFHSMAPLLTVSIYSDVAVMRHKSSLLFLTVCSVAARCWFNEDNQILHKKYKDIATLLNFALFKDVMYAKSGEITLELLEALQIYAHWMPLDLNRRFNEASAWNVIGLAIRWSKFLDLEKKILNSFCNNPNPSVENFRMLRILLNLLSLDYQLRLSSRLPTTIDPTGLVSIARKYYNHPNSEPDDIRLLGLCELTLTLNQPSPAGKGLNNYDEDSLKYINFFLDDWMKNWERRLINQESSIQLSTAQIPFTSMRWYKIALNTLPLSRLFSENGIKPDNEQFILNSLKKSVTSAVDMLSCFFVDENGCRINGYVPFTKEKWDSLIIDSRILSSFLNAVDSYWMTHAFSIILLCILYSRGAIDDHLFCKVPTELDRACAPPGDSSPLHKLLLVGCELFSQLDDCTWHPAYHLRILVFDVYDSVIQIEDDEAAFNFRDLFSIPLDNSFDLGYFLSNK